MYFIKSLVQLFYFFYFTAVAIQFLLDDIILGSGKILVWSGRPCYLFFFGRAFICRYRKGGPLMFVGSLCLLYTLDVTQSVCATYGARIIF